MRQRKSSASSLRGTSVNILDEITAPTEPVAPDPGPGKLFASLLAREGKLDPLLAIIRAEHDFWELQLRALIHAQPLHQPDVQAKAAMMQGRLSAYANLLGKLRAWGVSAKPLDLK
jgi:hypothetical protein